MTKWYLRWWAIKSPHDWSPAKTAEPNYYRPTENAALKRVRASTYYAREIRDQIKLTNEYRYNQ